MSAKKNEGKKTGRARKLVRKLSVGGTKDKTGARGRRNDRERTDLPERDAAYVEHVLESVRNSRSGRTESNSVVSLKSSSSGGSVSTRSGGGGGGGPARLESGKRPRSSSSSSSTSVFGDGRIVRLKIALVGSQGGGKSTLVQRWKHGKYAYVVDETAESEVTTIEKSITDTKYQLLVTDFSGRENYNTGLLGQAFKRIDCAIVAFGADVANFQPEAQRLLTVLTSHCHGEPPVVFARTKADLLAKMNADDLVAARTQYESIGELSAMAGGVSGIGADRRERFGIFNVSSLTGEGVDELLNCVIEKAVAHKWAATSGVDVVDDRLDLGLVRRVESATRGASVVASSSGPPSTLRKTKDRGVATLGESPRVRNEVDVDSDERSEWVYWLDCFGFAFCCDEDREISDEDVELVSLASPENDFEKRSRSESEINEDFV